MVQYNTSAQFKILQVHDSMFNQVKVPYFTSALFNNSAGDGPIFYHFSVENFTRSWFNILLVHFIIYKCSCFN